MCSKECPELGLILILFDHTTESIPTEMSFFCVVVTTPNYICKQAQAQAQAEILLICSK